MDGFGEKQIDKPYQILLGHSLEGKKRNADFVRLSRFIYGKKGDKVKAGVTGVIKYEA